MHIKIKFLLIAAAFIFSSCAGLGIRPGAQSEFEKGLSLFNVGKYEEAIPFFRESTEIDPNFARAYIYLGRSYINLGRWLDAVPALRTAYRLSPGESRKEVTNVLVDALFGAALFQFQKGNFGKSVDLFKEVLQLKPQFGRATSELALALVAFGGELFSKGEIGKAINVYTEAVKLSPNNLNAYLGLARAFLKNGDFLKALQSAQNALDLDPANKEAANFFRMLQSR